ncbi:NUDIX hydrolase [Candidatus Woesearchaeota archaeon]|jgi:8-oxo-dGTP pyrophosphatase MutT (NUDIX family)|nr:NUDIX hydrolase [Candidatus Woesearchaeota archaeon]MBT4387858.1 NUDIX hydrolase [Candidatus Woesearchaeota archaeon]MBT4595677.1 NUDIX hydrolase [Candidatus Woesearchaeota archaeon]MBT5740704.1 NUDIX hydrolase [Candidatus Woesearchaeota archaeon]MBT6505704.1 NUDIX hydrolase [Candidatus Woesearchaeota archaeon]
MSNLIIDERKVLAGCIILNKTCDEILLLYREDMGHYETPGGKVKLSDCLDPKNPLLIDCERAAEREIYEEIGPHLKMGKFCYFGMVPFQISESKKFYAHKFLTKILDGEPKIMEPETFQKLEYIPIAKLDDYPISPDLKLFKERLQTEDIKNMVHQLGFKTLQFQK